MSTARSAFTEAIEDHLALKKQNASLEAVMPLARYDVGDPLDRYPGGPNRAAGIDTVLVTDDVDAALVTAGSESSAAELSATQVFTGPSPEQAMEAATALEPSFGDRPFEPLNGMAPMLSLVEDIDDETVTGDDSAKAVSIGDPVAGDVLRFPGGVGPRNEAEIGAETGLTDVATEEAPTGEQPSVIVIDTEEAIATMGFDEPSEPSRSSRRKPRFFGLGRKKQQDNSATEGWFTDGPRDFNWD